jgi:hypothetical protein
MADNRAPTKDAGILSSIERFIRAAWHRLFGHQDFT